MLVVGVVRGGRQRLVAQGRDQGTVGLGLRALGGVDDVVQYNERVGPR